MKARITITLTFGLGLFFLAVSQMGRAAEAKPLTVWLDAGHGGTDHGCQAPGFSEASFSLDLCKRVAARLGKAGLQCVLSRQGDESVSITARVLSANLADAAAAVSLHANFSFSKAAKGPRIFVPPANGQLQSVADPRGGAAVPLVRWDQAQILSVDRSKRLGSLLDEELEAAQASRRGVQALPLAIFKGMLPPVALVECGFVSNPAELAMLKDNHELDALADKISRAILKFLGM